MPRPRNRFRSAPRNPPSFQPLHGSAATSPHADNGFHLSPHNEAPHRPRQTPACGRAPRKAHRVPEPRRRGAGRPARPRCPQPGPGGEQPSSDPRGRPTAGPARCPAGERPGRRPAVRPAPAAAPPPQPSRRRRLGPAGPRRSPAHRLGAGRLRPGAGAAHDAPQEVHGDWARRGQRSSPPPPPLCRLRRPRDGNVHRACAATWHRRGRGGEGREGQESQESRGRAHRGAGPAAIASSRRGRSLAGPARVTRAGSAAGPGWAIPHPSLTACIFDVFHPERKKKKETRKALGTTSVSRRPCCSEGKTDPRGLRALTGLKTQPATPQ